jgi:hypothetical protein
MHASISSETTSSWYRQEIGAEIEGGVEEASH